MNDDFPERRCFGATLARPNISSVGHVLIVRKLLQFSYLQEVEYLIPYNLCTRGVPMRASVDG